MIPTPERYRIIHKLGEGGMGEVYLVEHLALHRREALKVLHANLAREPEFVRRFRREARATNRVQHPNIVSVYDFGQLPDGRFFLAMEHAEGQRLDQLLAKLGRLPIARAVHVLRQLADAVRHAHDHGVVHRDLKPANLILAAGQSGYGNILRARPDTLKVLDFGIAKIIAPDYRESSVLTQQGHVFGTPAYIAPEQWQGAATHGTLDVYAIGCIGYELLTGETPFRGRRMELMHAHLTEAPRPVRARRDEVPAALEAIVMRCLAKEPAERFATAGELHDALARVGAETRVAVRPRGDFEVERTFDDSRASSGEEALADTDRMQGPPRAGMTGRERLRFKAEALLDEGPNAQLVLALSRATELEDERARMDAKAAALEAESSAIEQEAREREAALRFAVGELGFERDQASVDDGVRAELDGEIAELHERLRALDAAAARDLAAVTDRQVALVARAAALEDQVSEAYQTLQRLCEARRA